MGAQEEGKQQMFSPSAEASGKYTCSVHLVFILLVFKFLYWLEIPVYAVCYLITCSCISVSIPLSIGFFPQSPFKRSTDLNMMKTFKAGRIEFGLPRPLSSIIVSKKCLLVSVNWDENNNCFWKDYNSNTVLNAALSIY